MSLKEQVLQMVSSIDDEKLLQLVKADIANTSIKMKIFLMNLLHEPDEEDTLTENEFKAATARWRTK